MHLCLNTAIHCENMTQNYKSLVLYSRIKYSTVYLNLNLENTALAFSSAKYCTVHISSTDPFLYRILL